VKKIYSREGAGKKKKKGKKGEGREEKNLVVGDSIDHG
jgi:hypothetical protein